jgi:hypothetical protein
MNDPLRVGRFRWAVCEGNQILLRSPLSYATRGETEKAADDAMKRAEQRRGLQLTKAPNAPAI